MNSGRQSCYAPCLLRSCIAEKCESSRSVPVTYTNGVTAADLSGCDQICKGLNEQALNGALQVTRSVPDIYTFGQQELSGAVCDRDEERFASGVDAFLNHIELNLDDSVEFLAPKRFEDYHLVQT